MSKILCACVALSLFFPTQCRRNLSTIRYHFTTCGETGRTGPTHKSCRNHYTTTNSLLIQHNALTDTYSNMFVGSQSFRPPRTTQYKLTIASAAGGRGLCNIEFGRGLIVRTHAILSTAQDYLILVGHRGLGPCDNPTDSMGETLCKQPPQNTSSANECCDTYKQWLQSRSDLNFQRTLNISGGAGGGGTSFVGYPDIRLGGDIRVYGIAGSGGGSSAFMDNDPDHYRNFMSGEALLFRPSLSFPKNSGFRGYRVSVSSPLITAGAGGGIFLNATFFPLSQQDGRPVGISQDFAVGGPHCARDDFSNIPDYLRGGEGGFGGGGGGCGGGGGGGGFTGGAVLGANNTVPGGGGYTLEYNTLNLNIPYYANDDDYNEGDGYVDIVPTDCGCVGECIIYEEEDQFECLCPNYTQLAPDLSDCYHYVDKDVTLSNTTVNVINDYYIKMIHFGSSVTIYSMAGAVDTGNIDGACAILLLGDNNQPVAVTEPIVGSGNVTLMALTAFNLTDSSFYVSSYVQWLSEPQSITAGIIIDNTGQCSIQGDSIKMSVSLRTTPESELGSEMATFPTADTLLLQWIASSNKTTLQQYIETILQINETLSDPVVKHTVILSTVELVLVIVSGVVALGILCTCLLLIILVSLQHHRKKKKWSPPQTVADRPRNFGSSTLLSNHAYGRYVIRNKNVQTTVQPQTVATVHSDPVHFSTNGYEIMSYDETNAVSSAPNHSQPNLLYTPPAVSPTSLVSVNTSLRGGSVLENSWLLTPKFGHSVPFHDFVNYNRSRLDSAVREWQYPRSSLVYLRELGEGQFGKVLLMKAKGIAGYRGNIPVAVKTLTSRDTTIIKKFLEEAELMKRFSHPNIVSILGVCTDDVDSTSAPLMILEYMPFGDLQSFLESHRPTEESPTPVIKEDNFLCFATDVAKALEFLAKSGYVHRDIAARNCLVGAQLVVKIADFGLARGIHDKEYYRVAGKQMLPVRIMSPESLLYGVFTSASDVWSYGVLLWEIVMYGEIPLTGIATDDVVELAQNQKLEHKISPECPPVLSSLITQCHNHDPDKRPSFTDILTQLSN